MKRIFTILLVCSSSFLFAQNWSPILVNEKMNYQHSDSTYISHTIWVDSASYSGYDSIYYLNRVVKDVPGNPEIVLRNQPQFLMELMVQQNNGIYSFHYPFNYSISTGLPLGSIWIFDLTNIINAEMTACYEEEIFGVLDSVKMISLSDGNEIRLSKNFGILKFPDFENGGYFELVGIQNTDYGESVPGFWEIYDYEIGDVFQYSEYSFDVYYTVYATRKIEITNKEIIGNTINYSYEGIYSGFGYENKGWIAYPISGELSYTDSSNHLLNSFPNQLQLMPECTGINGTEDVFTSTWIFPDQETGKVVKHYGIDFDTVQSGGLYYTFDVASDTLYKYNLSVVLEPPIGLKCIQYSESIGQIRSDDGYFEYVDWKSLAGYVKDGDTVGNITPDSVLLAVSIDKKQLNSRRILIYPNPTNEWLHIKYSSQISNCSFELEIRNLHGQMVKKEKDIQSSDYSMNVADLKSGVYFYMIKEKGEVVQQGKIIKK